MPFGQPSQEELVKWINENWDFLPPDAKRQAQQMLTVGSGGARSPEAQSLAELRRQPLTRRGPDGSVDASMQVWGSGGIAPGLDQPIAEMPPAPPVLESKKKDSGAGLAAAAPMIAAAFSGGSIPAGIPTDTSMSDRLRSGPPALTEMGLTLPEVQRGGQVPPEPVMESEAGPGIWKRLGQGLAAGIMGSGGNYAGANQMQQMFAQQNQQAIASAKLGNAQKRADQLRALGEHDDAAKVLMNAAMTSGIAPAQAQVLLGMAGKDEAVDRNKTLAKMYRSVMGDRVTPEMEGYFQLMETGAIGDEAMKMFMPKTETKVVGKDLVSVTTSPLGNMSVKGIFRSEDEGDTGIKVSNLGEGLFRELTTMAGGRGLDVGRVVKAYNGGDPDAIQMVTNAAASVKNYAQKANLTEHALIAQELGIDLSKPLDDTEAGLINQVARERKLEQIKAGRSLLPPPAEATTRVEALVGMKGAIDEIRALIAANPEFIGPTRGTWQKWIEQPLLGPTDPAEARLHAALNMLRDDDILARSGVQTSGQEISRAVSQFKGRLPVASLPIKTFIARLDALDKKVSRGVNFYSNVYGFTTMKDAVGQGQGAQPAPSQNQLAPGVSQQGADDPNYLQALDEAVRQYYGGRR